MAIQKLPLLVLAPLLWADESLRAPAALQPSPTPVAWELLFQPGQLRRITVPAEGDQPARTFWYLPYRVVNRTGDDIDFLPLVERVSEIDTEATAREGISQPSIASRLSVDPAIVGLDARVFRQIQALHRKSHPFLVPPVEVIGRIRQGLDNARDSVIVFPELDPRVSRFTIYVGGLSGERQVVENPLYRSKSGATSGTPSDKEFVLQKTLAMPYTLPGDPNTRRQAVPGLGRMYWVMR
ncbi:MAG: hypothetical protein L6Q92_10100 [Phycisphaerae bacterium]|nr:hypothetical protein [Phycisphaerae bacterium]